MANPIMYTKWDLIFGFIAILLVLEGARRTIGWVLPSLAIFTIIYSWLTGTTLEFILSYQYHYDQGMWGTLTMIGTTIIAIFLIFGTFLLHTGGGQTFIDIAVNAANNSKGGPAKIAVIASGLFGMLSGSAVANTATTGNFTIPLMKNVGYKPETAGAIEAVASTGGQIVPPIMGSSAFIMAELLGISYLSIVLYAIMPAIIYYLAIFFYVHFTAIRDDIESLESQVSLRSVLTWTNMAPLVFPLVAFIVLLAMGFTPVFSGLTASVLCFVTFILRDLSPAGMWLRIRQITKLLNLSGKSIAYIVCLMTCAQIIVGMLGESGLATKLASFVVSLGEANKAMGLIAAAVLAIILGMGVPPVGAYVLTVAIAAPALFSFGIQEIPAHFFVLNFANFGAITPPICAAVFVAAAIAKSRWLPTGIEAVKIASTAMVLPFTYTLFAPYLLGMGPVWLVAINFVLALVGSVLISSAMSGAFFVGTINWLPRLLFLVGGFLMVIPFGWQYRLASIVMVIIPIIIIFSKREILERENKKSCLQRVSG
jgi:TRAP transporter 4TM/12TM fusion protein